MGVTPPEAALFNVVHFGITVPPTDLPFRSAIPDYSPAGPVTKVECQAALADCLAKGWLQVIDEAALAKIAHELREGRWVGPIYGFPDVGVVEFTHAGAELWQQFRRQSFPDAGGNFSYLDTVHIKTTEYYRTISAAVEARPEADQDHAFTVTGPSRIGPWRLQWWRRFSGGYRVDIEEKMHWQGRSGGGGSDFVMIGSLRKTESKRLPHILECHNVTLSEWLVLAAMEGDAHETASDLPRQVTRSAVEDFGLTASEEECRIGLEACLRNGWLRVVDQQAIDEVQALLRDDPAFLPVPDRAESRPGEVDFTPAGAALYRMIAAEWLGRDWEDSLSIENVYYREEHHYCEHEEGFQSVRQELADSGEVVRSSKLVPLGPWCSDWWNRFPAGYRLELKIGDP